MSFLFFSIEKEKLYLRKRARAGDNSEITPDFLQFMVMQ
jgi:hypothetical protein